MVSFLRTRWLVLSSSLLRRMDDLSRFCCLRPDCALYGLRGAGNLTVCGRFGKHNHIRLLYCRACKDRFSERKGTPLFGSHLPEDKARAVLDHLAEGNGTRQTSRLVGVHRDTVTRLARRAGQHAQDAHDELVAFSPSDPRSPVGREVGLRRQEAEELRPCQPG
ncbi:MAG: helix-turn-helix domain-containing protein [Solirubrobacterales bacterium]